MKTILLGSGDIQFVRLLPGEATAAATAMSDSNYLKWNVKYLDSTYLACKQSQSVKLHTHNKYISHGQQRQTDPTAC